MTKTIAPPSGPPPNRLTERGRWAYRQCGPQLKHLAGARNKCPSHIGRELSGERPSPIAEAAEIIRDLTRAPKTTADPIVTYLIEVQAEERASNVTDPEDALNRAIAKCVVAEADSRVKTVHYVRSMTLDDLQAMREADRRHFHVLARKLGLSDVLIRREGK